MPRTIKERDLIAELAETKRHLGVSIDREAIWRKRMVKKRKQMDALRAELAAAKERGDGLYLGLRRTLEALGGVAQPGVSEAFLILGVPGEAAALKRVNTALAADNARLRKALDPFARAYRVSMKPFAPGIDEADGAQHWLPGGWPSVSDCKKADSALAATPAQSLDSRDRSMKAIGAAEELERLASVNQHRMLDCNDLTERAAQLRREAEDGK